VNKNDGVKFENFEERLHFFKKICYKHGLKITPQRVAIYKELISSQKHPSAIIIFRKIRNYFPNISLGTVNSTLLTFAKIGLAKVVESSGDPKRFDPQLKPHHHFRCMKCGEIVDFHDDAYDAITIPAAINKKFVVLGKIVHLEGLCDKCRTRVKR
jgi:Fur family peroxide stress response transcriptional regulator